MADANQRPRHFVSLEINQVQEISWVVVPAGVISQQWFVQYAAQTLLCYVGYPDPPDAETIFLGPSMYIIPQGLVEFLGEAACVGPNDGDVSWLRVWIVLGYVLFHGEI